MIFIYSLQECLWLRLLQSCCSSIRLLCLLVFESAPKHLMVAPVGQNVRWQLFFISLCCFFLSRICMKFVWCQNLQTFWGVSYAIFVVIFLMCQQNPPNKQQQCIISYQMYLEDVSAVFRRDKRDHLKQIIPSKHSLLLMLVWISFCNLFFYYILFNTYNISKLPCLKEATKIHFCKPYFLLLIYT